MSSNCLVFFFFSSIHFFSILVNAPGILTLYFVLFMIQEMAVFSDISDSCKEIRLIDKALNGA